MIENLLGGGGKGGTVDTIQAGTGISVNSTDPANPIVSSTVVDTNDAAKVSSNDTTAGYLNGKLVAGSNVTLTENNNGGNETLTIAATVPVTSVNTKTGAVTLTNTDVGAAATSHTHAASDITSGIIATARLGTGTANSTTYLAGDQTYKAAVTSVNGSTGAVTVAAGDTTYTVTTADCENTTSEVTVISFTVPANTWGNGERIKLETFREMSNLSGSSATSTTAIDGTGITSASFSAQTINTNTVNALAMEYHFYRENNGLYYSRVAIPSNIQLSAFWGASSPTSIAGGPIIFDSSVDFTVDITINIKHTWSVANATIYQRVIWARASKQVGQR